MDEPNDPRLRPRMDYAITTFLQTQWRNGALLGAAPADAFSVSVGSDTMTDEDRLNGRLIVEIGVAPVRPADFVIFRVFQNPTEARP